MRRLQTERGGGLVVRSVELLDNVNCFLNTTYNLWFSVCSLVLWIITHTALSGLPRRGYMFWSMVKKKLRKTEIRSVEGSNMLPECIHCRVKDAGADRQVHCGQIVLVWGQFQRCDQTGQRIKTGLLSFKCVGSLTDANRHNMMEVEL